MAKGLAAVQERIRKSFLEVHNDQRTREQRQADEEMLASIQAESPLTAPVLERSNLTRDAETSERRSQAYISAALRSRHIKGHMHHRASAWFVGSLDDPAPDLTALFSDAIRNLEKK